MIDLNWNQYKAAGKHVASFAAGGVGVAVALHFITPSQATDVNGNLTSIFTGLQQVATGIAGLGAVLVPIYTAWRASHNAAPAVQAAALVAAVPGTVIVTTPELAAAVPSKDVVSNTEVKAVVK